MLDNSKSMFDLIGGAATVDRLVDAFYRNMDELEEARAIRAVHAEDLGPTRAVLKLYLAEWLGGPAAYSAQKGHPRLRSRHMHIKIGPAERDAWLLCMNMALEETVQDEVSRAQIAQNLAKLADWMRNDPDNAHDNRQRS
ncbi:MAG TPA: group II truncated hemoglobin [Methylocystis sp.]|nr:group II truncated hemoglobin [Methylocystis sp.]